MSKVFSTSQKEKLATLLAEMDARGLILPDEVKQELSLTKKIVQWPVNEAGCFTSRDGRSFIRNEHQAPFIFSDSRFAALISGRGGGKTASGAQKALRKIKEG